MQNLLRLSTISKMDSKKKNPLLERMDKESPKDLGVLMAKESMTKVTIRI